MERLSGLDATFLYLETPTHHMHVAMTMVLDPATMPGGYSFDKLKAFIRSRLHVVPLFHRRLAEVPFRPEPPGLGRGPGLRPRLPRPPHRCPLARGPSRARRDRRPDRQHATRPHQAALGDVGDRRASSRTASGSSPRSTTPPSTALPGADFLVHLFDLEPMPAEVVRHAGRAAGRAPAQRPRAARLRRRVARASHRATWSRSSGAPSGRSPGSSRAAASPEKLVGAIPLVAPRAPRGTARSPAHRQVGVRPGAARRPQAHQERLRLHASTTWSWRSCAGTLRELPASAKGAAAPKSLLAVCPISVRDDEPVHERPSANRVSAMFVSLATRHRRDPPTASRHPSSTKGAKEEHNAVGADDAHGLGRVRRARTSFNLASRLYSSWGWPSRHRPIHNVIISNVPGPTFPLYFAGAELVAAYPLGPGDGRLRPQHHRVQLPRLRRRRLHGVPRARPRCLGHGRRDEPAMRDPLRTRPDREGTHAPNAMARLPRTVRRRSAELRSRRPRRRSRPPSPPRPSLPRKDGAAKKTRRRRPGEEDREEDAPRRAASGEEVAPRRGASKALHEKPSPKGARAKKSPARRAPFRAPGPPDRPRGLC